LEHYDEWKKVMNMGAKRSELIWSALSVSALMLPAPFALADNTQLTPSNSQTPGGQNRNAPSSNFYSISLPRFDEKSAVGAPPFRGGIGIGIGAAQEKPGESNTVNSGLHWSNVDSHPGVGYQLDRNQDLRVHFGGHGAVASFAVHF
jgi:hypothetical protein